MMRLSIDSPPLETSQPPGFSRNPRPALGALTPWTFLLACALGCLLASPAAAQSGTTFVEQERVTAIDLLVGLEESKWRSLGRDAKLPADFDPLQLRVEHAGEVRAIVSAEKVEDGRPVASEPWTFVIFVDAAGSRSESLRWAADQLAQDVETLIRLGSVEVVVSTPEVQVAVPLTREARVLHSGLSNLALEVEGQDALGDLRYAARRRQLASADRLDGVQGGAAAGGLALDGASALAAEKARVLRHQDELLTYLTERFRDAGPRRCVFWLTGGFDIEPERFYGVERVNKTASSDGEGLATSWPRLSTPDLVEETRDLARTLSAYGWITVPMLAPPPDALRGKASGRRAGPLRFLGNSVRLEENRRPDRAEAYLELAAAHAGGDRYEDAADAYERAYYFFGGDPRTKDRQAVALAGLGVTLDHLGQKEKARKALELAADLDPAALPKAGPLPSTGRFIEPDRALRLVAGATSGRVVRSGRELDSLYEDLGLRLRVTFQLPGAPTGKLESMSVLRRQAGEENKDRLLAPTWARFGVPARVDRALARTRLDRDEGELGAGIAFGGLEVLQIEPLRAEGGTLDLRFDMRWPGSGPRPRGLRLTFVAAEPSMPLLKNETGLADAGAPLVVERQWAMGEDGRPASAAPALEGPVEFSVGGRSLAVIWRDLETGAWGGVRHLTGLP